MSGGVSVACALCVSGGDDRCDDVVMLIMCGWYVRFVLFSAHVVSSMPDPIHPVSQYGMWTCILL